jgi:RPA family protein
MITPPSLNINKVSITGQVIGVTFYEDSSKLVFTVKNPDGSFCVEFHPLKAEVEISRGDQVMVMGSLFSMRSGRYDAAKIRARTVKNLDSQ